MKYPITPEYLENAPKKLIRLYEDFEADILADIFRRLAQSGTVTESALEQIRVMQRQGKTAEAIQKKLEKLLNMSRKELDELFQDAVERNEEYLKTSLTKADIIRVDEQWRPALQAQNDAIRRQTEEAFVNLTQSMGFAIREGAGVRFLGIAETYQRILDRAALEVSTGAMDYNTVIRRSVRELADSGIVMVNYASGWRNRADVAVRRAVMTGVTQISAQYSEKSAELLGTPLREVSAHRGAMGYHPRYPNIYDVCGLGDVAGLEGANCRHMHFPFVEGVSERTYTDEQLEALDPPPFAYQGREYTAYEATQKQRQMETAIRAQKRRVLAFESAGEEQDAQDAKTRLKRLESEYRAFSQAAGLPEQFERARIN